jgi:hypothetical protein
MREERQLALPMMFDTPTATSIVIIESHGILRECLRALIELEGDLRVVGEGLRGGRHSRGAEDRPGDRHHGPHHSG